MTVAKKGGTTTNSNQVFSITKTNGKENKHSSFCICGISKSGRTRFAGSFEDPIFMDLDYGLETVKDMECPVVRFDRPTKTNNWKTSKVLAKILKQLRDKEGDFADLTPYPKTLVIDSGTALSYHFEEEVRFYESEGKSPRGDGLYLGDYNIIQNRLMRLIDLSKQLTEFMHVVWIFNIELHKDETQGGMFWSPAVTGQKFSPQIPHFFNEVYFTKFDVETDNYILINKPFKKFPYAGTKNDKLRKAFPDGKIIDPSYSKLKKFFT